MNLAKDLGITDADIAKLQKRLDSAKKAKAILDRMKANGVECEGREGQCLEMIGIADVMVKSILSRPG